MKGEGVGWKASGCSVGFRAARGQGSASSRTWNDRCFVICQKALMLQLMFTMLALVVGFGSGRSHDAGRGDGMCRRVSQLTLRFGFRGEPTDAHDGCWPRCWDVAQGEPADAYDADPCFGI